MDRGMWGNEPVFLSDVRQKSEERFSTGIKEFDRVLGGGVVEGGVVLIGGEPGIGKSTLLLQVASLVAQNGKRVLYISGEESLSQISLRAKRLHIPSSPVRILCEVNLERIKEFIKDMKAELLVIDSIQTIYKPEISSSAGTVSQLRESASDLIQLAKKEGKILFLIGHVTKEGTIAGPRVLEHMVDTVLYFEGEKTGPFRILKTFKNRFGSTQEIGIFEMDEGGLKEVKNASEIFLTHNPSPVPGAVIVPSVEGSRPFLVEIQALVIPSTTVGFPKRVITGVDYNRVMLLLAVLEKMKGLSLHKYDLFVNVVGGIKIEETATDLAVLFAITSSVKNRALPQGTVAVGEVGLAGEVRGVSRIKARVNEAEKLGFEKFILPKENLSSLSSSNLEYIGVKNVVCAINKFFYS